MKKILTLALFVVATLASCQKNEEVVPTEQTSQNAMLTLNFAVEVAQSVTRSQGTAMEREIRDINLYLYNETMTLTEHLYLTDNRSVTLPVARGEWSIYAIANSGADMGEMTQIEVQNYRYEINAGGDLIRNDALVMSYQSRANIIETRSLDIEFSRAAARLDVRVSLASAALSKVMLKRIRLVNANSTVSLFATNSTPQGNDLISYDYLDCGNGSTFSIYTLENLSGINSNITNESDKTVTNAPATAAYLEIEAETSDAWVTYRIYLGENNTSDFNIRRNHIYEMEVTIFDATSSDFRCTIRPFPVDIYIGIASGSISVVRYKYASAFIASETRSAITFALTLNKASQYDINVNFEMMSDRGEVYGGMTAIPGTYDKPLAVHFPAGTTYATLSLNNTQEGLLMWAPTHLSITGTTKLNAADENRYYPPSLPFVCSYTERWQNY